MTLSLSNPELARQGIACSWASTVQYDGVYMRTSLARTTSKRDLREVQIIVPYFRADPVLSLCGIYSTVQYSTSLIRAAPSASTVEGP